MIRVKSHAGTDPREPSKERCSDVLLELTEKPQKSFLCLEEWIRKMVSANSKSSSEIGTCVDEDANPVQNM